MKELLARLGIEILFDIEMRQRKELMTKERKSQIIVLAILAVVLGIFILILGLFKKPEIEELIIPEGNLSNSLFDSQNTTYVPNDSFPGKYSCTMIPYTIDTVAGDGAIVDTGIVYPAGNYYFYFSEVAKEEKTSNCVGRQFAKVLNFNYNPDEVLVETMQTEAGFLNGFGVEYQVVHLRVPGPDGQDRDAYLTTYRLLITASESRDLIIGVATGTLSTDTLKQAKQLLDVVVPTVQFDDKLNKELTEAAEKAEKEAQEAAKKAEKEAEETKKEQEKLLMQMNNTYGQTSSANTTQSNTAQVEASGNTLSQTPVTDSDRQLVTDEGRTATASGDAKTMGILLKNDYTNLTINVKWTNLGSSPTSILITDSAGQNTFKPESVGNGTAVFNMGATKAGVYIVKISGYADCGTFTSELVNKGQ